ncbi:helix-turn-helix domain-containing protein [Actinokineospora sp. HUAS TT18]|uniref:helix-turn-helix domain-containing protein n=1 Tax=Actinokineospora sp. HUAS TT18 TaxID=3447451 RepID=UPI003F51B7B2
MSELSARLRALATELESARTRAGLKLREVSARVDISLASLSRIENALRTPTAEMVSGMLVLYRVVGEDRVRIMNMLEAVKAATWMEVRPDFGTLFKALVGFEAKATSIFNFAPSTMPGLLQTAAYARAITRTAKLPDDLIETLIAERLERQKVLDRISVPTYVAILDEAVIRRPFGGGEVMAHQLRWLIDRAQMRHISIHVIPFRHGGYDVPGHFSVFDFRESSSIAYVEQHGACGFLHQRADVASFQDKVATLGEVALGSADSVNFLAKFAADYERGLKQDARRVAEVDLQRSGPTRLC